jgi:hypothetical protein
MFIARSLSPTTSSVGATLLERRLVTAEIYYAPKRSYEMSCREEL